MRRIFLPGEGVDGGVVEGSEGLRQAYQSVHVDLHLELKPLDRVLRQGLGLAQDSSVGDNDLDIAGDSRGLCDRLGAFKIDQNRNDSIFVCVDQRSR